MGRVDREKRKTLLNRLRTEHTREDAALLPAERFRRAIELLDLAPTMRTSDEPPDLWLRVQRVLRRRVDGTS